MVEGVLLHPRSFLRLGEFRLKPRDMVFGLGVHWKLLRVFGIPLRRGGGVGCSVYGGRLALRVALFNPVFCNGCRFTQLPVLGVGGVFSFKANLATIG